MNKEQAEQMAISLMRHHGLYDYKFSWMQARGKFNRAGQCNWKTKTIQLQPFFVKWNYPVIVKQTILHEIAHALTPKHGHNKYFQKTASALGHIASDRRGRHTYYGKEVKRKPPRQR